MRLDSPPRVLITGAGTGIGRACAEAMASRGAELILCDNDAQTLREATDELGAVGRFCDVASEASVAVFAADIIESFKSLDLLINAAGGGYERTLGMARRNQGGGSLVSQIADLLGPGQWERQQAG